MDGNSGTAKLQPFSDESAQQLKEAADALITALEGYARMAAAATEPDTVADLYEAGDWLAVAGARFDQAHLDHLTIGAPIGDIDLLGLAENDENDDEDHAASLGEESAIGPVSVFTRQDFMVTDPASLFDSAGESAHANVSTLGHVLCELIHRDGRDKLDDCEGLVPMASITLFQQGEAPLRAQMEAVNPDYQLFMQPRGETLYSFGEVW